MRHRRRSRRPVQRRRSCLSLPVLIGVLLLILVEGYIFMVRPQISSYIGQQVSTRLYLPLSVVGRLLEEQLPQQAEPLVQVAPTSPAEQPQATPVPQAVQPETQPLSSGSVRLTETQMNAYITANMASLEPVESLVIRLVPGQIQADVQVFGTQTRVVSGVTVQNGRVELVDPQMEGVLGLLVSMEDLTQPIEDQLNNQLLSQGYTIRDARIEQGQIVVLVDGTS